MTKAIKRDARVVAGLVVAGLLLAASAGCGALSDPGYIAFMTGEEGSRRITVVQPSGEGHRVIVDHPSDNSSPVWSPDRRHIAFLSDRDGNTEVYVAPADGVGVMRVTNSAVAESQIVWSPDGTRLAYVSPDHRGVDRVYWVRLADLLPNRLEFTSVGETDPAWSPMGTWIAFAVLDEAGESLGIRLRNPDGVNQILVSDGPDRAPVWSPDGRKLAFVSWRDGQEEIYVMPIGPDGPTGESRRVTDSLGRDFSPHWSPDGRRIAFLSNREGNVDVYIISERGSDLRQVTRNTVDEVAVVWGPDGRIVFESQPTGQSALFIMDQDDTQRQLAAGQSPSQPAW
ncbi:MAG: hypothetical protein WD645_07130 [Dehalococcoidia bacterium]